MKRLSILVALAIFLSLAPEALALGKRCGGRRGGRGAGPAAAYTTCSSCSQQATPQYAPPPPQYGCSTCQR